MQCTSAARTGYERPTPVTLVCSFFFLFLFLDFTLLSSTHKRSHFALVFPLVTCKDELYGPTAICILLFAAVLANFVIRVKHHNGKMKTPKSPWLAAYLNLFVNTDSSSALHEDLHF